MKSQNKMEIKKFTPPKFEKAELNMHEINELFGKAFKYASMGRYALFHVLNSLECKGKIMVPPYICSSIINPISKKGLEPIYYDIDEEDLNADLESIKKLYKRTGAKNLLVASMYGNPANLTEIERYCNDNEITLIDDAAQSFGATLNARMVGSFGSGGFFSFSPGKPTAGHMGAFFWSNDNDYNIKRTSHYLFHAVSYYNFYFNRLYGYQYNKYKIFSCLNYLHYIMLKVINIENDHMNKFEHEILGGILNSLLFGDFEFRNKYHNIFINKFYNSNRFTIIKKKRGNSNNHKLILKTSEEQEAKKIITKLNENKIYSLNGYKLLTSELKYLPNAAKIKGNIIEIPIENDEEKMDYIFNVLGTL
jgi:dTDP-4-amino-4,6-dideoxygalactose transaminase